MAGPPAGSGLQLILPGSHSRDDFLRPRCYTTEAAFSCCYAACLASGELDMLTALVLTFAFLGVVIALGAAFIWMFWEIEQSASSPRRHGVRRG